MWLGLLELYLLMISPEAFQSYIPFMSQLFGKVGKSTLYYMNKVPFKNAFIFLFIVKFNTSKWNNRGQLFGNWVKNFFKNKA